MKRNKDVYLYDLIEACIHIHTFIGDLSCEDYKDNILVKRAIEHEFEIIGEVLRRIRDEMPSLLDRIPNARLIIGFRNVIAHGYDVVSDETIYRVVKTDLSDLLSTLEKLKS